jgi:hypothetical protein
VTDLPEQEIPVRPWWRRWAPERRQIPSSFLRPVILIGATKELVEKSRHPDVQNEPYQLKVRIDGKEYEGGDFDGYSTWIGCEQGDLAVPGAVQTTWQKDLADPAVASQLLAPRSRPGLPQQVGEDQRLQAFLYKKNKRDKPFAQTPVLTIHKVLGTRDIVQAVQLDIDY